MHLSEAVKSHALPVYKKSRIDSLLCIFETIIYMKVLTITAACFSKNDCAYAINVSKSHGMAMVYS